MTLTAALSCNFVTDPRIRWVAIDDTRAQMFFPFGAEEDSMTVYFDAKTDLITKMTALRYFGAGGEKEPWQVDFLSWQQVDGMTIPIRSSITWEKQGKPWSYWDITGAAWNVDLSAVLSATSSTQPAMAIALKKGILWPLVIVHFLIDFASFLERPGFTISPDWNVLLVVDLAVIFTAYGLFFNLLVEFGDIVMMRKCMLGIKRRAEALPRTKPLAG